MNPSTEKETSVGSRVPTLSCPKCGGGVRELPPNSYSRNPGLQCEKCEQVMRTSTLPHLGVLALSVVYLACLWGLIPFDADGAKAMFARDRWKWTPLALGGVMWSIFQLSRPRPTAQKQWELLEAQQCSSGQTKGSHHE